jgi:hypothetical protein
MSIIYIEVNLCPLVYLFSKTFNFVVGFPIFWLWVYLMKVIWLSNLLIMRVPNEGYLAFQSFDYECTWWRLFGFPIFWLWVYLMKVIWLSNLLIMSVHNEGYLAFQSFDYERTWWRLFGFPIFWLWAYLMKVI